MRKHSIQTFGLAVCLITLCVTTAHLTAQISVYSKLTGTEPLFSNEFVQKTNVKYLRVTLKAGYDDLLRKATQKEQLKFARWTYGASIEWKTSENQSWFFDMFRSSETFDAIQMDSSWNFTNQVKINQFRITHRRKLGRLPFNLLSYFQIYDNRKKTLLNYGVGIQGRLNNYRFGFEGEYKSWFPFFQTFSSNNLYQIEVLFPSLANIRQLRWSVAGSLIGFNFESFIRTGKLVPSSRQEREYTFMPSAEVQTFMGSLQKTFASSWQTNLKFILDQIKGDGILRFRDRKYGSVHLHTFRFYDVRFSINQREKPANYEFGIAYQRLSGKTNASIESWPFDDSGVDFFREKQSLVGSGHIALSRTWLQSFLKLSKVFYINLLAEYIHVKPDVRLRTWGSALIFGTGQVEQHVFDKNQNFLRIGISPKLKLSKNLNIEFLLNQWIPIDKKATTRSKGGTFGRVILSYNM